MRRSNGIKIQLWSVKRGSNFNAHVFWAFSGYFLQNLIYDLGFASMYRWCAIPGAIIICIILLLFDARKWLFFGSLSFAVFMIADILVMWTGFKLV